MTKISPTRLKLAGDLSLRGIAELKARLVTALGAQAPILVETSGVESIDVGCLQLLVAAQKTANASGAAMSLSAGAGGPVARALIAAGFHAADGRPLVPEAATWMFASEAR